MTQFLYPFVRQFPFDETCELIVRELEKRAWRVPGMDVEFYEFGGGNQTYRRVSKIKAYDFILHFCREQRRLPGGVYNDVAAITEIRIPRQELHVYRDESGPTYYLYVGDDYERDREDFLHRLKVHSKLNGCPRTYLAYHGECRCFDDELPHFHRGERPPFLAHGNDCGREFDARDGEPTILDTADVMEEFRRYLEDEVLRTILEQPVPV